MKLLGRMITIILCGSAYITPLELNLGFWWTIILQFPFTFLALVGLIKLTNTTMKTKEELIASITKKVSEVVPDVMESKMGCKIVFQQGGIKFNATALAINHAGNYLCQIMNTQTTVRKDKLFKILGRPITLEDILVAMQELKSDNWQRHWVVNRYGTFLNEAQPEIASLPVGAVGETWTLGKPLHEQTEETLLFIDGILN